MPENVIFAAMAANLRRIVKAKVESGTVSETGLAIKAGISQPHMHNWLAGKRHLSIVALDAYAEALGVSDMEMLGVGDVVGGSFGQ
jgi:transcriptional regulator with XRE-family HTH domain